MRRLAVSLALLFTITSCTGHKKKDFWIYTSSYKEMLPLFEAGLRRAFPDVQFHWFQAGSENVAAKVSAELTGGGTQADFIMTSDIFFTKELKKRGALLKLDKTLEISKYPADDVDPDMTFVVNRFPVMVIAYNPEKIADKDKPTSFKSLGDPKYKGKLAMPSPLESGTTLIGVFYLQNLLTEAYFKGLRANDILASGGNGAVISRIQTGERPVGIVLMENVLQARDKGATDVNFVVPEEGALPMPSPLAIFKTTKDPVLAKRVLDWFLSPAGTETLIKSYVYSPVPGASTPKGGPDWASLKMQKWDLRTIDTWAEQRQSTKDMFQKTVLN